MKERFVNTKRGKVFYWISENWDNAKNTIFFFPGLTTDHTMFFHQFQYFEGLYNIISWDPPGHGKSRPYKDITFKNMVEDIVKILDENCTKNIIAIGQSLGGYCVQSLLLRYPEKVKCFVAIGTAPYGESYLSKGDIFGFKNAWWLTKIYPFNSLLKLLANQSTSTDNGYKNMMKMTSIYTKKEYSELIRDVFINVINEYKIGKSIYCPVIITHGEHDKTGKVQEYCKKWSEETGFPLVIIKNAGHNANVDNPEEMNKVILNFIKNIL